MLLQQQQLQSPPLRGSHPTRGSLQINSYLPYEEVTFRQSVRPQRQPLSRMSNYRFGRVITWGVTTCNFQFGAFTQAGLYFSSSCLYSLSCLQVRKDGKSRLGTLKLTFRNLSPCKVSKYTLVIPELRLKVLIRCRLFLLDESMKQSECGTFLLSVPC